MTSNTFDLLLNSDQFNQYLINNQYIFSSDTRVFPELEKDQNSPSYSTSIDGSAIDLEDPCKPNLKAKLTLTRHDDINTYIGFIMVESNGMMSFQEILNIAKISKLS